MARVGEDNGPLFYLYGLPVNRASLRKGIFAKNLKITAKNLKIFDKNSRIFGNNYFLWEGIVLQ